MIQVDSGNGEDVNKGDLESLHFISIRAFFSFPSERMCVLIQRLFGDRERVRVS